MQIGFVGLGTMGGPMARRLVEQGHRVTGYDVDAVRGARAREGGVALAASAAGAAESADAVLSSLPDPAALRRAYLGPDGVLGTVKKGATLIDLSTVDPDTWREVAAAARAKGLDALDAPVSGGPAEAGSGKLVFLVGGEPAVLERCRPLLLTLGTEIHHVGPLGSGQIIKLVNNVMSIGNVAVAAEAMVLGVKAGMDPQRLFDILSTSGGRSHHFLKRFPNVLAGDFTPYFGIGLSRKDVSLALGMAAKLEVPMLVASTVRQVYEAAHAQGFGQLDMAAVIKLYEHWTGVTVRSAAGRAGAPNA
jgi:3-hydroxyisobutyrate dehydrogenase-like beta-hydroxyacid dehydrogenase